MNYELFWRHSTTYYYIEQTKPEPIQEPEPEPVPEPEDPESQPETELGMNWI